MKIICAATLLFFTFGCAQTPQSDSSSQTIASTKMADSTIIGKVDSAITRRGDSIVKQDQSGVISKNELVRLAVKDKLSEEWLYDQTLYTDTAEYFVYHIGHTVTDEGGINARFITDQWVYVDSAAKILYEVDLSKDSVGLIRWSK